MVSRFGGAAVAVILVVVVFVGHAYGVNRPSVTVSASCHGGDRGRPLSVTPLVRWSKSDVADRLASVGLSARAHYGVNAYRCPTVRFRSLVCR